MEQEQISKIKALADKTRIKILEYLLSNNYCVRALAEEIEISESAVSQHLKILREANLVLGEKKGYFVHYSVKRQNLKKIARAIEQLAERDGDHCQQCD